MMHQEEWVQTCSHWIRGPEYFEKGWGTLSVKCKNIRKGGSSRTNIREAEGETACKARILSFASGFERNIGWTEVNCHIMCVFFFLTLQSSQCSALSPSSQGHLSQLSQCWKKTHLIKKKSGDKQKGKSGRVAQSQRLQCGHVHVWLPIPYYFHLCMLVHIQLYNLDSCLPLLHTMVFVWFQMLVTFIWEGLIFWLSFDNI